MESLMKMYDNINYCHNYGFEPDCEELIRFINWCAIKSHHPIGDKIMEYLYNFYEYSIISNEVMVEIDELFSITLDRIW